jgi:hypothetical protein
MALVMAASSNSSNDANPHLCKVYVEALDEATG